MSDTAGPRLREHTPMWFPGLDPGRMQAFAREREDSLHLTIRREATLIYPPSNLMGGEHAVRYLTDCYDIVVRSICANLGIYSKAQWLWYLRRLPQWVLQNPGDFVPHGVFERNLAEALTGTAGAPAGASGQSGPDYPVDRNTTDELLRLAGGVKCLASIDWRLRSASRGLAMRISDASVLPDDLRTSSDEDAARLYIRRLHKFGGRFLARAGSSFGEISHVSNDPNVVAVLISVPPRVRDEEWETPDGILIERFHCKFGFQLIDVSRLTEFLREPAMVPAEWPPRQFIHVLTLCALLRRVMERRPFLLSALMFGYLSFERDFFIEMMQPFLSEASRQIARIIPGSTPPADVRDLLEQLERVQGSIRPLSGGPIVRQDGTLTLLDLHAATSQLEVLATLPSSDGIAANWRAKHFEDMIQRDLDCSPWAPSEELRKMQGRSLRLNGETITDVDAIGQYATQLLIVSAKSRVFTAAADVGDYSAVRNATSIVLSAVDHASDLAELLKATPKGDNYDFSSFARIAVVVCIPYPIYLPIGRATAHVEPGLAAVSSLEELRSFVRGSTYLGGDAIPLTPN